MVFPGRFSTGCRRCRQRKIKCDGAKPSCRRCYLYGQPCPGYTDQFHFRYNNSTSAATGGRGVSSPGRSQQVSQPEKVDEKAEELQSQSVLAPIGPQPEISYDDVSLCYFVRRFVTPFEADSFPGHLSFLPSLFSHHSHGLLELATLSVAQMAAYNQFGANRFRLESYHNYGRALHCLRSSIQSDANITDDRVIAAVLLLCIFKASRTLYYIYINLPPLYLTVWQDISGESCGIAPEHASGLHYLVQQRGPEQLCTKRGFELFLLSLIKLQVYSFSCQDDRYSDPGGLVSLLSLLDPMMQAMSLMTRSLGLRHALLGRGEGLEPERDVKSSPLEDGHGPILDDAIESTLSSCFDALGEFDKWDLNAEAYWRDTFQGRSAPAALGEVATRATYYDPETACTLILVRSARLVLLLSILEYFESTACLQRASNDADARPGHDSTAHAELVAFLGQNARSTIDDMLWCVPFALGDLDAVGKITSMPHDGAAALVILQPIRLVTYCAYATSEQKARVHEILNRLNISIGVRSAVSWEQQLCLAA